MGFAISGAVALLLEEFPHLAPERGHYRIVRSAHPSEDEPAPFTAEHTPGFGGRMVHVDVMKCARREDRRHASILGGPATVALSYQDLSAEPRFLHLLAEDREHRRGAIEANVANRQPEEGKAKHA